MYTLALFASVALYVSRADADEVALAPADPAEVTVLGPNVFRIDVTPRSAASLATTWSGEASVSIGWNVHRQGTDGSVDAPNFVTDAAEDGALQRQSFVIKRDSSAVAPSDGHLVFQIRFKELHGRVMTTDQRYYFRVDESGLIPVTHKAYVSALESKVIMLNGKERPVFVATGSSADVDDAVRNLPPWDNPELSENLRREAAITAGSSQVVKRTGAMSLGENEAGGGGCSSSGDSAGWKTLLPLILFIWVVWIIRRRNSMPTTRATGILAACIISTVATSAASETRTVYGYLSFWDTRSDRSNANGCRRPICDTGITDCDPGDGWDCCFSAIPNVQVALVRAVDFAQVDVELTMGTSGLFMLTDTNWQNMDYYLVVAFARDGYPASFRITDADNVPEYFAFVVGGPIQLSGTYTYVGNRSVNVAGDTTSFVGDVATAWTNAYDTFIALEGEGETRHRKNYGSANDYDEIAVRLYNITGGPSHSHCSLAKVDLDDADTRTFSITHELGHQYHGRVVGCNGNAPLFPAYYPNLAWRWGGAEGTSIPEGLAQFVALLSRWDPNTADTGDILADWEPCATDLHDPAYYYKYDNNNDCSSMRNSYLGLWEFIDTSTADTDVYADYFDLTLTTVMDSLLTLKNTNGYQGQNRTANEQYFVSEGVPCVGAIDCNPGEVCDNGDCKSGDPHGGNIRDWTYHLAINLGASDTEAWQTLQSSQCVGTGDNSFPFRGGYRTD
jgi:hypothetical protein